MSDEYRPLLPTLRNEAYDRHLRHRLSLLRDHAPDRLARMIDDVLDGRRSLRGLAETDEMNDFVAPLMTRALKRFETLSEDERDRLAEEAREQFGDLTLRYGGDGSRQ